MKAKKTPWLAHVSQRVSPVVARLVLVVWLLAGVVSAPTLGRMGGTFGTGPTDGTMPPTVPY